MYAQWGANDAETQQERKEKIAHLTYMLYQSGHVSAIMSTLLLCSVLNSSTRSSSSFMAERAVSTAANGTLPMSPAHIAYVCMMIQSEFREAGRVRGGAQLCTQHIRLWPGKV